MGGPITRTSKKVLNYAHKLLKSTSKVLFGTTAHVTRKSGKAAAKLLGKVGKLSKPVRLDNGAIQYTLNGVGKGVVIVTGAAGKIVNSAGKVTNTVLKGAKGLGVVVLDTTGNVIKKLSRGHIKIGGRKSRRKCRRKGKKSRRKRKRTRRRRRKKGKRSRRRRRR